MYAYAGFALNRNYNNDSNISLAAIIVYIWCHNNLNFHVQTVDKLARVTSVVMHICIYNFNSFGDAIYKITGCGQH